MLLMVLDETYEMSVSNSVYQVVEFPGRSLKYYSPIVTHGKIFGLILTRGKSIKPKILPCVTMVE